MSEKDSCKFFIWPLSLVFVDLPEELREVALVATTTPEEPMNLELTSIETFHHGGIKGKLWISWKKVARRRRCWPWIGFLPILLLFLQIFTMELSWLITLMTIIGKSSSQFSQHIRTIINLRRTETNKRLGGVSKTPDHNEFVHLAQTYTKNHPYMEDASKVKEVKESSNPDKAASLNNSASRFVSTGGSLRTVWPMGLIGTRSPGACKTLITILATPWR